MSKYRIKIEGKVYEVEIEPVDEPEQTITIDHDKYKGYQNSGVDPVIRIINSVAEKKTDMHKGIVRAPIPGTIISVKASVGDIVQKGQIILLLEAMKMNNEISASVAGKISAIYVTNGSTVQRGDVLFEIS